MIHCRQQARSEGGEKKRRETMAQVKGNGVRVRWARKEKGGEIYIVRSGQAWKGSTAPTLPLRKAMGCRRGNNDRNTRVRS